MRNEEGPATAEFFALVEQELKYTKDRAKAVRNVVHRHPTEHQAMLDEVNADRPRR